jgi:hypothetical protein
MNQMGLNINSKAMLWFGLSEQETIEKLLAMPHKHVRIPIPFDEVNPQKGVWNFSKQDYLIEQAIKHKKKIHLQLGIKTIGYPEIHAPSWLLEQYPYLTEKGVQLDRDPGVQVAVLQYIEKAANRYLPQKGIASVQIENEPFSKRLGVTNFRFLSTEFHQKELELVKKYHIPLVQNIPFDTPYAISHTLYADILGLNIYNQCGNPWWLDKLLWIGMYATCTIAALLGKRVFITEYQVAPWINEKKEPSHPFTEKACDEGLEAIKILRPEIIFLWDIEQKIWRKEHSLTHL